VSDQAQGDGQQAGHAALLHATTDEFVAGALGFVNAGLDGDEPVLVSAPEPRISFLRDRMNGRAHRVSWADTVHEGANPARLLPVLRAFADAHVGRPVRFLQEMAWAARTAAEQREAIRHEALINVAFADAPVQVLCSYDSARLDPAIIRSARSTHPTLVADGTARPSPAYDGGVVFPDEWNQPLDRPPHEAAGLTFHGDLAAVRAFAARQAGHVGLPQDRVLDLVLAVGEIASNTFVHTEDGGTLAIWRAGNEVVCQIQDSGYIVDPLAGRRRPAADADGGHGLWLVHQVCDLVELRSVPGQTVIRLHMRLDSRSGTAAA
jgi:anti-sigma regulatory factor (Ser/Thr protein kinase)